jgi:hypothetical protein
MAATISRTDSLIRKQGVDKASHETGICKMFIERAWTRVHRNARRVDFEADSPLAQWPEKYMKKADIGCQAPGIRRVFPSKCHIP